MKLILIVFTLVTLTFSRNTGKLSDISHQTLTALEKADRHAIIKELKRLKALVESEDKEKISGLFEFPLPDSVCNPNVDSAAYYIQYEKNGNKMSKAMFLKYYKDISNDLRISGLKNLFKHINLNDLLQKDTVQFENVILTQPCYRIYAVGIKDDKVTLDVGSSWNENFKDVSNTAGVEGKYYNELCAHMTWWKFKFDGKKLHLINIGRVG